MKRRVQAGALWVLHRQSQFRRGSVVVTGRAGGSRDAMDLWSEVLNHWGK